MASNLALQALSFVTKSALPIIRQAEVAECGNACLAMVANYHGFRTDTAALRKRFPGSARGLTLRQLAENASRIGFATRALQSDISSLRKLQLPVILHWDLNHFVVLKSISRRSAVIHDPAKGRVSMDMDTFGDHFTGVVLELTPTSDFEARDERTKLKFSSLWSQLRGLGPAIAQILVLSVLMQAYILVAPQYLQIVIDTVLPTLDTDLLVTLAIGFGLLLILNIVATVLRQLVVLYAGTSMGYQISINLFSHLARLPLSYFERRHVGDIVSRFSSIDPIRSFLTEGVVLGLVDGLMAVITLGLMLAYSPLLALVSVTAVTLFVVIRVATLRSFRLATEDSITTDASENSNFMETVRGAQTIKASAQEDARRQRWQNLLADSVNQSVRVQWLGIGFRTAEEMITGIEYVVVVFLAAGMVMAGDITIGMIFAYMAYREQFVDKTTNLVELLISYRMLALHLDRIADIAVAEPEPQEGDVVQIRAGRIEVRNLRFAYEQHLPMVIEEASFTIEPGEYVALVGPSGSGKSTLLKLLMGLLPATRGEILVDGATLSAADPVQFRRQIGSVLQDDVLFAGSIADNISFFDMDPDPDRIVQAAALAAIHEDILAMPMGYETPVGDMGSALSGGQTQRVQLARALYRQPRILFVDEGTSNLDVETERTVNEAIDQLGITRIIVAHRPETIRFADRILEVSGGKVREHMDVQTDQQS